MSFHTPSKIGLYILERISPKETHYSFVHFKTLWEGRDFIKALTSGYEFKLTFNNFLRVNELNYVNYSGCKITLREEFKGQIRKALHCKDESIKPLDNHVLNVLKCITLSKDSPELTPWHYLKEDEMKEVLKKTSVPCYWSKVKGTNGLAVQISRKLYKLIASELDKDITCRYRYPYMYLESDIEDFHTLCNKWCTQLEGCDDIPEVFKSKPIATTPKPTGGTTLKELCNQLSLDPKKARRTLRNNNIQKPYIWEDTDSIIKLLTK